MHFSLRKMNIEHSLELQAQKYEVFNPFSFKTEIFM